MNYFVFQITSRFPVPPNGSLSKDENDKRLKTNFEPLVNMLVDKYRKSGNRADAVNMPDTIEDINRRYRIVYPASSIVESPGN